MKNMTQRDNIKASIQISADEFASLGSQLTMSNAEAAMLAAASRTGGLITTPEALALHRLCQRLPAGARILEIGSYLGASTTAIGHAILGRGIDLYCLDCWHDYQAQGFFEHTLAGSTKTDGDIFLTFQKNTNFLGEQLRLLKGTTEQFREFLPNGFFDLIFIDGAHDFTSVISDIILAFRALKPGGIICGHDFHSDGTEVTRAVNELIAYSPGIQAKGVVPETSIWYGIVDDTAYEHARSSILAKVYGGDTEAALNMAFELLKQFPDRTDASKLADEIISLRARQKGATNEPVG